MKKDGQYVGIQDEYVPEDEKYVDNSINEGLKGQFKNYVNDKDNQEKIKMGAKKGLKYAKRIGIGYLIFYIIMMLFVFGFIGFVFVKMIGMRSDFNNDAKKHEITYFNQNFDWYIGTQSGSQVNSLLTEVTKSLKTNKNHIITVSYNGTNTSNSDEVTALKKQFDDFKKYEVSMDYDSKGYINKITITDY